MSKICSNLLIDQQFSFIIFQVIFLSNICGFNSTFHKLSDFLQIHVDEYLIKIHLIHLQAGIIKHLTWEILHTSKHLQKNLLCPFITGIFSAISKRNFWKNLHLITILHLDQPHIILDGNDIANISLVYDPHKIQRISIFLIAGILMDKLDKISKCLLVQIFIFFIILIINITSERIVFFDFQ